MRSFFLFNYLLIIALPQFGFAQKVCVELQRQNILFLGVNNPIEIYADTIVCDSFTVSVDNGKIQQNDSSNCNYFEISPEKVGMLQLEVYKFSKKIGERKYKVIRQKPVATLSSSFLNKSKISAEELKAENTLRAEIPNSDTETKITVEKFSIIVLRGNYLVMRYENKGAKFLPIVEQKLQSIKPNDLVIFSDIYVRMPDNRKFRIEPIEYIID